MERRGAGNWLQWNGNLCMRSRNVEKQSGETKTMVDALVPAADALEANADNSLLKSKATEVAAKQQDTKKLCHKIRTVKSLLERVQSERHGTAERLSVSADSGHREYLEDKME